MKYTKDTDMEDGRQKMGDGIVARFEDLEAWQRARVLVRNLYQLTRRSPLARDFGLAGQIQRAGVSTMSNIAEGFERTHVPEKSQFYNVARASSGEVRSLLYVVEDNYPSLADTAVTQRAEAASVGRLVSGLVRSTERRKTRRVPARPAIQSPSSQLPTPKR